MGNNAYQQITREIFHRMEEGLHVLDQEGVTVVYNDAMAHMKRMSRKDVLDKPFRQVFGRMEEEDYPLLLALEQGKTTINRERTQRNQDGKKTMTTTHSSYPVMLKDEIIGAVEIAQDITDLQRMTQSIMNLQKEIPEPVESGPQRIRKYNFDQIIGQSRNFLQVIEQAKKTANGNASVLLYGETGTGKELIAQSIHYGGQRREKPFLAQNCAALPEHLLEGILFGTAKGGFTGALDRAGLFEQADGGTLLLDEISAMPYALQGKILRVLQEDYVRRIGGSTDIPIDVRIIATLNEPAEVLMEKGKLRKDLYYRLNVIFLSLPPLRERRDDILPLAEAFLEKHCARSKKDVRFLSKEAQKALLAYEYPGNVRELENIIMAGLSMVDEELVIKKEHLGLRKQGKMALADFEQVERVGLSAYMEEMEWHWIQEALVLNEKNISRAAAQLGIKRQTLQHKLKRYR